MLFDNDIVLIDEARNRVNNKLEKWRDTIEFEVFRLNKSKIECLEWQKSQYWKLPIMTLQYKKFSNLDI